MNTKQSQLATLFGKSQSWISKKQKRSIDPMPLDFDRAHEWGRRLGLLGDSVENSAAMLAPAADGYASTANRGTLELEDLRLKRARGDLLELEKAVREGLYVRTSEVEQREVALASDFRRTVVEYPLRARAILERNISDAVIVERIIDQLNPLAAELLNKEDATVALAGKCRDEIRVELQAHVERLLEAI